jgi:putative ABC transport system ATP-binding protein
VAGAPGAPTTREPVIIAQGISHYFGSGGARRQVLDRVSTEVFPREIVILTGPSGSGKTTLLTLLGGLRAAQEGSLRILGRELRGASKRELVAVRQNIGFIFQEHNLLESLSAVRNVAMGLARTPEGLSRGEAWARCEEMLSAVGLGHKIHSLTAELSGGQKQRVAVARALVGRPRIVLADEPTASLDKNTGREVAELLHRIAKEQGAAVLLVTHDNRILDFADRVEHMEDGQITSLAGAVLYNAQQLLRGLANTNRAGELTRRVLDLPMAEFASLLGQVTAESQQLLRAMDLANDEAFESMLDQAIEAFTLKAGQLLTAERGSLFLVDAERQELWSKVADTEIRIPLQAGIAGHVATTGQPLTVPSAYDDPRFNREVDQRTGHRTRDILAVPVKDSRGRVVGVLEALNKLGGASFDAADEERFLEFGESLAVVVETWSRMQRHRVRAGEARETT